jgi:hypothetical protein
MQQTGPVHDVITYCAAIFACAKSGPRQQALGFLRRCSRLVPYLMSSPIALPSCLHEERAEAAVAWVFAVMQ